MNDKYEPEGTPDTQELGRMVKMYVNQLADTLMHAIACHYAGDIATGKTTPEKLRDMAMKEFTDMTNRLQGNRKGGMEFGPVEARMLMASVLRRSLELVEDSNAEDSVGD